MNPLYKAIDEIWITATAQPSEESNNSQNKVEPREKESLKDKLSMFLAFYQWAFSSLYIDQGSKGCSFTGVQCQAMKLSAEKITRNLGRWGVSPEREKAKTVNLKFTKKKKKKH